MEMEKRPHRFCQGENLSLDVTIQTDGKIIAAGYAVKNSNFDFPQFALVRYNTNGSLDTTFDADGMVTTDIGTETAFGKSMVLQSDGKIVVAGNVQVGSLTDFAIARYWAFPPQESWRLQYFGITTNTGNAADTFDFDLDGLPNLAEYAFGLIPTLGNSLQTPSGQRFGNDFLTSFTTPSGVSGITYSAEWSMTLMPLGWTPIPDTGTPPQHTFSVPIDSNTRMFMRLKVTSP
jgi:uncharacterized delta-60 repeat protein